MVSPSAVEMDHIPIVENQNAKRGKRSLLLLTRIWTFPRRMSSMSYTSKTRVSNATLLI